MLDRVLICTDLDRTLLPNGAPPESPGARDRFRALTARPEVELAFVSGRHRALVESAIAEYQLPQPDYVIGDVGSSIYAVHDGEWSQWSLWNEVLESDWGTRDGHALIALFDDIELLTPQESEKQGRFKSSYYAPLTADVEALQREMQSRLDAEGLPSKIIWSIDDNRNIGLIDVLPRKASKLEAVRFLMKSTGHALNNTLFAGDSGNDLAVLCSEVNAVLVANATDSVREQALRLAAEAGAADSLYTARGGFRGMNGNYSAGILEGLAHYIPETEIWIP
ncbi:MAG: HAD-IIB family hydrolase [Gammaproteobacteria bacterium]|jgi:HAD superfamily hydrolase (TIGR01484 family)